MKKKKRSRAAVRQARALNIAKGMVDGALIDLYNSLCVQPLKRRIYTAWRILRGKQVGAK